MSDAKIFDSHAHYDCSAFDEDRDELIKNMLACSVCGIINCGTDYETSRFSVELSHKIDGVYAAVGIHPEAVNSSEIDVFALKQMLSDPKAVAVGEIGLDYHYQDGAPRDLQIAVFEQQLVLANELSKPVIVHEREAHSDVMQLLEKHKPQGVLHCFSSSAQEMQRVLNLGMYIGMGGTVTFKNARVPLEVAAAVPLERLLLETDCPYMSPEPFRGKRNDSTKIIYVAQKIADIKGVDVDTVLNATADNTRKLFGI